MSQAPEILAALQQMRSEAEATARQRHRSAAETRRLEQTRSRLQHLQPTMPPQVRLAYEQALRQAEIDWLMCRQPEAGAMPPRSPLPALSLTEQEALLQALMHQAVLQYVDAVISDDVA